MHRIALSFLPTALVAFAATAAAQESRGPFVGLPAAVSVEPLAGLGFGDGATTFRKTTGFQLAVPSAVPNRDLRAILASHGAVGIDVDDLSMGLDWIQVEDSTGRTLVPNNQWAAFTLSVTAATQGALGSRIAAEAQRPGGAGAALFSYVLTGSAPPPLVSTVERVHAREELGLPLGADVDGLDQLMPMWELQPAIRQHLPLPQQIFFTVSAASVSAVPASWWATAPPGVPSLPSGATIFVVTSSSGVAWSPPQVWKTYAEIGLVASDDIDGLSIDLLDERILLSTTNPALDPLLFVYYGNDFAAPVPVVEPDDTPVSTQIGLVQNDDVDAICATDPSARAHPSGSINPFFFYLGTPRGPDLLPVAALHGSACRSFDGVTVRAHTWVSGWPPLTGQGPGVAAALLTFGNNVLPVFPLGGPVLRNPGSFFAGDPHEYTLVVPAFVNLGSTPVTFRWFAADAGFTELAEAWPVGLLL